MLLRDKDAESFGAIDPQSTFLNRLQQDNDSRRNMCYFEEISIKLGEVHASLYKVNITMLVNLFLQTISAIRAAKRSTKIQRHRSLITVSSI